MRFLLAAYSKRPIFFYNLYMKFFIESHGCQMNVYDSQKMAEILQDVKMAPTEKVEDADLLLMNTCSVRVKAHEKVFSRLGQWKKLKDKKPHLLLGVGGCVATLEGERIAQRAPYVDIVFGPQTIHRLPQLIDQARQKPKKTVTDIRFTEIEKFDNLPEPCAQGVEAFVSIMEGCSKYCSFCVVPYTRGEEVSRPIRGILREITLLARQGVKEVTLLGQNVNAYSYQDLDFAQLLHLVAAIDGIERIRYTTSHPLEMTQALIDAYARIPQLVDHLHLPVQSGSDRVLATMKRNYTALEYKEKVHRLRRIRPDISLSSDFIVGFPGETEEDFEATMGLVRDLRFDKSFSFIYSRRPGTPASYYEDATPQQEKEERLQRLQALLSEQTQQISRKMVGTAQTILVSDYSKKDPGMLQGRTANNRLVHFRAQAPDLIGQFMPVKIVEALNHSLRGIVVNARQNPPVA